jgi:peptide/nickel transport system permease protein
MFQPSTFESVGSLGRIQRMTIFLFGVQPTMLKILLTILGGLALLGAFMWATRNLRRGRNEIRIAGTVLIAIAGVALWVLTGNGDQARSILYLMGLPLLTLVLVFTGEPMLLMRTTMMESMRDEYVTTARAKGIPDTAVRDRHAARTALLPVISRFLLSIPFMFTGSLVVEAIFSWPGIGSMLLYAADVKDYALVLGVIATIGLFVMLSHLALDVINVLMDPRVRHIAPWQRGS